MENSNKDDDNIVHTWYLKGGATAPESGNTLKSGNGVLVEYGIISIGYWLDGDDRNKFNKIHDFANYKNYYETLYKDLKGKTWNNSPQAQLYDKLKKGDIVWTRVSDSHFESDHPDGYYVARIPDDPKTSLFYCNGSCVDNNDDFENLKKADCLVGLKNIKWEGPFSEDAVPGSVSRYIMGKTFVRADSKEMAIKDVNGYQWTYTSAVSYLMYCEKARVQNRIKFEKLPLNSEDDKLHFLKLIGWRGLEDITALWLQKEYGYYLQPSTCKSGTPSYEYVLIDPTTKKRIFVQTKNDDSINLNKAKYRKLLANNKDEFYLVTPGAISGNKGKIVVLNKIKDYEISLNELIKFVFNDKNDNILPEHIVMFKNALFNIR